MLIDELLSYLQYNHAYPDVADALTTALHFQVDNVARYFTDNYTPDGGIDLQKDIPNIAPLSPVMWLEYGGIANGHSTSYRYGCLISIEYDREDLQDRSSLRVDMPEARWSLRSESWWKDMKSGKLGIGDYVRYIAVGDEGQYLGMGSELNNHNEQGYTPKEGIEDVWDETSLVAFTSICFAHCKGVEVHEQTVSRQVRRASERTGKPVISFHTIDIQPSIRVLRTEGNISENGLAKALHICRGNFAHYTADKPLFGKYTGTFYRPMHIRGSAEQGVSIKDYRVLS